MFTEIFQFYKLGKQLGLHKKEINKILLFGNRKHPSLYLALLIVAIIASGIIAVTFIGIIAISKVNTYPAGTKYSTVKEKDFKITHYNRGLFRNNAHFKIQKNYSLVRSNRK